MNAPAQKSRLSQLPAVVAALGLAEGIGDA